MTDVCQTTIIHKEKVDCVKEKLERIDLTPAMMLGKCMGDPSRIKILSALETVKEMCVCDLAEVLEASLATTSHHLRFLKKQGIATSRKDGKVVYYSIANEDILSTIRMVFDLSNSVVSSH